MADQRDNSGEAIDLDEYRRKLKAELKKELLTEIFSELKSEKVEPSKGTIVHTKETESKQEVPPATAATIQPAPKVEASTTTPATLITPSTSATTTNTAKEAVPEDKITLSVKVFLKIASHALKYANKNIPRDKWVEVIGLLAGKLDKDGRILHVEDAYPMGHGDAVYAEIKDYKNYVRAFNDLKSQGLFICGWYHSHPSYGLFLSEEDMGTQARYQKLWDKSIALVIDPYQINGESFGFNIFRANLKTRKWFPVPFSFKTELDVKVIPELVEFINPIVDGKALFMEYDQG